MLKRSLLAALLAGALSLAWTADGVMSRLVAWFALTLLYAYLAFVSFHAAFIHANLRWRFPVLRWLIATREYHHWHHSSDAEGIDKNFASALPLWDLLFGTAHQPGHWPRHYGTVGEPLPETYLGQLRYPFQRRR